MITNEKTAQFALTVMNEAAPASSIRQTYHELSDRHLVEGDVVEQLKSNINQLEDLHARLRFVMSEITYLLKKS